MPAPRSQEIFQTHDALCGGSLAVLAVFPARQQIGEDKLRKWRGFLDPIQTLLQTLDELDASPLRTALRSLLEQAREQVAAHNAPRTVSLLGEGESDGALPTELVFEDRYVLGEELGSGAMGTVYRAQDRRLRRAVALKVLTHDYLTCPSGLSRFVREARVTGSLQHPAIVAVHDVGILADGRPFYAMREVQGDALATKIASSNPEEHELRSLVGVLLAAAEGVGYAHSRGVVHRDLKPDNIMVGSYGDVAVVDWGLAKTLLERGEGPTVQGPVAEAYQTITGRLAGSPAYMPPEQARGEPVDTRADVYALGATLWHILAGRAPFSGMSGAKVIEQLMRGRVPQPPVQGPGDLIALCKSAMASDRAKRPSDAGEFAASLRDWVEGRQRQGRAEHEVDLARADLARAASLHAEVRALRRQLGRLDPADRDRREQRWEIEDQVDRVHGSARRLEVSAAQHAQAALAHVPKFTAARALLAEYYAGRHREAERAGRRSEAEQLELFLRTYDDGTYARYVRGKGRLTMVFDGSPSIEIYRVVDRSRRHVLEPLATATRSAATSP
jgi:hypothetical protein